jgi:hypothetical protein
MKMKRDWDLRDLLAEVENPFRLVKRGNTVVAVEDVSPPGSSKAVRLFWKNASYLGVRRYRQELPGELFFLNLIITVNGINKAVARQLNFLFGYISNSKLHGFKRHLQACTGICRLLS